MLLERTKKIIIIVGFLASVIIIGTALYFMFFAPTPKPGEEAVTGEVPTGIGELPMAGVGEITGEIPTAAAELPTASEVARGGLTKTTVLTASAVYHTELSTDGQSMNYYDGSDDRFYTIASDGSVTRLSNKQFPDAEYVSWNRDGDKALIEFPDGSNIVYNFDEESQMTLPKHWEDFEFSPSNDEIIAKSISVDPSARVLVVSNDDGSQVQVVQALGDNEDKVDVNPSPHDQIIAFSDTGGAQSSMTRRFIIPLGKNQENFRGLTVEGLGFEAIWSPRGDYILYSVYGQTSDYQPLLWSVSGSVKTLGEDRQSLDLNTWVSKCVFVDNDTAYCAAPQDLPDNAGFQPTLGRSLPDDLYRLDLSTGKTSLVARPAVDTALVNLQISDDGSLLYYTNAVSNRLEYIRLK